MDYSEHQQKLFMDRYALKNKENTYLEDHPSQMYRRVADAVAQNDPAYGADFYSIMSENKFIPGGRILAGAGTGAEVTYYNCFRGDTLVHLDTGIVPISTLTGTHNVLSQDNTYRPAEFKSYGIQNLWEIELHNGQIFHATPDHSWVVKHQGRTERVTTQNLNGRRIPINAREKPIQNADYFEGIQHGITFGDGSAQNGSAHVCLFGYKQSLANYFSHTQQKTDHIRVTNLPVEFKALPDSTASSSYWYGFVVGLIATDGHVDRRGHVMLHNKNIQVLEIIRDSMAQTGFVSTSISCTRNVSPYDGTYKPVYKLSIAKATITEDDLIHPVHKENFQTSPMSTAIPSVKVIRVTPTTEYAEVFCCVEPETHTITVGHGYLTGQCFVIEQPEDSRGGILDNIKYMTEIMARGGGVGVNLSSLRPDGAYIKSVNGYSSGPVNWGELYSTITGKIIQQGGSRRGALMLMLDDDHPDIEKFITAKDIDPITRKPVALEFANVSVAVSDRFMQAVKDDADWHTQFPTSANIETFEGLLNVTYGKVYKARYLWNLICERAHKTAEPGVVFMERCQNEANTGYYERIRCTNPCGEQPIGEFAVCNLGAMNLSAYVTNQRFDYEGLAHDVGLAVRFLDNVIDLNFYFLDEFKTQLDTRRIGLGTMGLADMFIKLGVRYGSEASLQIIDRVYGTIRDAAYLASTELAAQRGVFGHYKRDQYLDRPFIQRLPYEVYEKIEEYGIRNALLLTQAPTGTTSMIAGVSSGIEPVFSFVTKRKDRTGEHVLYHPLAQEWHASHPGQPLPDYFVTTQDLRPEDHIAVQARIQKYTDSSISKTVNGPNDYTVEDVQNLYMLAYDSGCKGVTFYRDGSRDAVLTHVTNEPSSAASTNHLSDRDTVAVTQKLENRIAYGTLSGVTMKRDAPEGKVHFTINSDQEGPIETFVTIGRAGSDISAATEAVGRLISAYLQLASPVSPLERLQTISQQFMGLGGSSSIGFGTGRIKSFPDAVAKMISEYVQATEVTSQASGGLCPECGSYAMRLEEGCEKCHACGYSKC